MSIWWHLVVGTDKYSPQGTNTYSPQGTGRYSPPGTDRYLQVCTSGYWQVLTGTDHRVLVGTHHLVLTGTHQRVLTGNNRVLTSTGRYSPAGTGRYSPQDTDWGRCTSCQRSCSVESGTQSYWSLAAPISTTAIESVFFFSTRRFFARRSGKYCNGVHRHFDRGAFQRSVEEEGLYSTQSG